jgi:hypothetical protein
MGCDDYPRPECDIAYDETLKLVGQLTGVASYGRDLLKAYQQRGDELTKLRAERDQFKAERDKAYHNYKLVRAENADLRHVRIADRLRGLKAVQVLKQLVDAIEDDHAGDMSPLWAEARRVLGETK